MISLIIIDTGCANLYSVKFAFDRLGYRAEITRDIHKIQSADKLLLPGVGTAMAAMQNLAERNLIDCIRNATQPMLGICLSMQLMTEFSTEGNVETLGLMHGQTDLIPDNGLPLPHMGWNKVRYTSDHPLFAALSRAAIFTSSTVMPCNPTKTPLQQAITAWISPPLSPIKTSTACNSTLNVQAKMVRYC